MQFIDLKTQHQYVAQQVQANINEVFEHGKYIMGPEIAELEQQLAEFVGAKYCIGVSNGSDALMLAMMALDIQPGDEVITTPFTFISTATMILMLGAVPVFVDIDEKTYNLDPNKLEQAITKKTKAIMPVSLYGQCADFDAINAIAAQHNLPVIEDAAQSLGATYKERQSCSLTTIACTSFFPSKPLGCYGDGGACFTNDEQLAAQLKQLRVHGQSKRYYHTSLGMNGRLDTLQAAILLAKLPLFKDEVTMRDTVGGRYSEMLAGHSDIVTPFVETQNTSVYAQYTIRSQQREQLQQKLTEQGIPFAVHYPTPVHQQPILQAKQTVQPSLPIAEAYAKQVLSLPMHPYLEESEQQKVVDALT